MKKNVKLDVLTGEQFKQLIEQKTPDGLLNTIPEVFEKLKDIPDDVDLEDWIRQIAEESGIDPEVIRAEVEAILNTYADDATDEEVDSWFDD